ncbi:hypothetical protein [Mycolicibacterium sp. J2]|uniref:hypothetical protein n=1 Tax=Mycolicibacterium sp. J2 TaxID=2993511 RepID=UPI00224AB0BC|nr:hypothetical protein [Mycolicibacterium sp. J2]MCX2715222.1 hypothetical protein [Mycolicibacterium sp. J2]
MTSSLLPLRGLPKAIALDEPEQLALLGQPTAIRVPELRWRTWLDDPMTVARFEAKRYRRPGNRCWVWMGAVSSTGHGSFRAASLPGPTRRGTVSAHLFAYQLAYGVIPRLGWSDTQDDVICHQCDFAACTNPEHMHLGTNATNRYEYLARRGNLASPLADVRGAAGRARAIASAVRTGLARNKSAASIERLICRAERAGHPWTLW